MLATTSGSLTLFALLSLAAPREGGEAPVPSEQESEPEAEPEHEPEPEPELEPEAEPEAESEPELEPDPTAVVDSAQSDAAPGRVGIEPVDPNSPTVPEPVAPSGAKGGFGQVGGVSVESTLRELPSEPVEPEVDEGPGYEITARAELGYAQTDIGSGLDHQGLFLRLHMVLFPFVLPSKALGLGLGLAYTYQGLNRADIPEGVMLDNSSAQQQALTVSGDLLLRPHRQWFSIHLSPMLGVGWYSSAEELLIAGRAGRVRAREYAFVGGGSAALCTAWDIACVIGGSEILLDVETRSNTSFDALVVDPWSWHVGVGIDVLRVLARVNQVPQ